MLILFGFEAFYLLSLEGLSFCFLAAQPVASLALVLCYFGFFESDPEPFQVFLRQPFVHFFF